MVEWFLTWFLFLATVIFFPLCLPVILFLFFWIFHTILSVCLGLSPPLKLCICSNLVPDFLDFLLILLKQKIPFWCLLDLFLVTFMCVWNFHSEIACLSRFFFYSCVCLPLWSNNNFLASCIFSSSEKGALVLFFVNSFFLAETFAFWFASLFRCDLAQFEMTRVSSFLCVCCLFSNAYVLFYFKYLLELALSCLETRWIIAEQLPFLLLLPLKKLFLKCQPLFSDIVSLPWESCATFLFRGLSFLFEWWNYFFGLCVWRLYCLNENL